MHPLPAFLPLPHYGYLITSFDGVLLLELWWTLNGTSDSNWLLTNKACTYPICRTYILSTPMWFMLRVMNNIRAVYT